MEENEKKPFRYGYSKGVTFGIILLIIGALFLGINFGMFPAGLKHVIISWQMLLIVAGLINLANRHIFSGSVLIAIGGFFIIPKLAEAYPTYFPGVGTDFTHVYWPLLLIAAGVLIIISKIAGPSWWRNGNVFEAQHYRHHHHHHYRHHHHYHSKYGYAGNNGFSKNTVFGSGEHIVLDPEFKGGEVNAVFGGITLDLRKTNLPEGETFLEINAVFGGVTIFVPSDWFIETHIDTVFGGYDDKRMIKEDYDKSKKLLISGSCVFGGFELRN